MVLQPHNQLPSQMLWDGAFDVRLKAVCCHFLGRLAGLWHAEGAAGADAAATAAALVAAGVPRAMCALVRGVLDDKAAAMTEHEIEVVASSVALVAHVWAVDPALLPPGGGPGEDGPGPLDAILRAVRELKESKVRGSGEGSDSRSCSTASPFRTFFWFPAGLQGTRSRTTLQHRLREKTVVH